MDLRLRDRSTLELLEEIRREHPALPVLILTSFPEEQYALAALRAGARGYVPKDATADEILDAIARVAAGRTRVSERITELLAQGLASPSVPLLHERLSRRELDVFMRLARGETVGDIAAALGVSIKTVSTYRTRILEKTGFRSNADIVAYAVRGGLLP
jgi:DNA-binding NarL/FixJ family response regulator